MWKHSGIISKVRLLTVPLIIIFGKIYRKKIEASAAHQNLSTAASNKGASAVKRKRAVVPKKPPNTTHPVSNFFFFTFW